MACNDPLQNPFKWRFTKMILLFLGNYLHGPSKDKDDDDNGELRKDVDSHLWLFPRLSPPPNAPTHTKGSALMYKGSPPRTDWMIFWRFFNGGGGVVISDPKRFIADLHIEGFKKFIRSVWGGNLYIIQEKDGAGFLVCMWRLIYWSGVRIQWLQLHGKSSKCERFLTSSKASHTLLDSHLARWNFNQLLFGDMEWMSQKSEFQDLLCNHSFSANHKRRAIHVQETCIPP